MNTSAYALMFIRSLEFNYRRSGERPFHSFFSFFFLTPSGHPLFAQDRIIRERVFIYSWRAQGKGKYKNVRGCLPFRSPFHEFKRVIKGKSVNSYFNTMQIFSERFELKKSCVGFLFVQQKRPEFKSCSLQKFNRL